MAERVGGGLLVAEPQAGSAGPREGDRGLADSARLVAANFVAMEDGYQMDVLAGRRSRQEVIAALYSYSRCVTGYAPEE
ncbi:hypothetical protein [Streptomyces sp. ISL-36]|uniref:hypothetical protein n=1 Tax=Streptomyces sp. ISL-36 TaxID=2819182 RepID=UPI0020362A7D|nr:hypothetical protein [Streptomyces sp. ISL-36]